MSPGSECQSVWRSVSCATCSCSPSCSASSNDPNICQILVRNDRYRHHPDSVCRGLQSRGVRDRLLPGSALHHVVPGMLSCASRLPQHRCCHFTLCWLCTQLAERLGLGSATGALPDKPRFSHAFFGLVQGADGRKLSSRDGVELTLQELLNQGALACRASMAEKAWMVDHCRSQFVLHALVVGSLCLSACACQAA